jgi:hypothetical protein
MDRVVLLTLLAIPLLVIIHVALLSQPPDGGVVRFWAASQDEGRLQLQGHWQSPEPMLPVQFVVERTAERGS